MMLSFGLPEMFPMLSRADSSDINADDIEKSDPEEEICYKSRNSAVYRNSILKALRYKDSVQCYKGMIGNKNIEKTRNDLVRFIVKLGKEMMFSFRTISSAIKLFDSLIEHDSYNQKCMQTNAAVCLFIAGKFDGCEMDDKCSFLSKQLPDTSEKAIIQAELDIMKHFNFNIDRVTPFNFLDVYMKMEYHTKSLKSIAKALIMECLMHASLNSYSNEDIAMFAIDAAKNFQSKHEFSSSNKHWRSIVEVINQAMWNPTSLLYSMMPNSSV